MDSRHAILSVTILSVDLIYLSSIHLLPIVGICRKGIETVARKLLIVIMSLERAPKKLPVLVFILLLLLLVDRNRLALFLVSRKEDGNRDRIGCDVENIEAKSAGDTFRLENVKG